MSSILGLGVRAGRVAAGGGDLGALLVAGGPLGMAAKEAISLLRGADERLSRAGWTQGGAAMAGGGEPVCLLGAIWEAQQR